MSIFPSSTQRDPKYFLLSMCLWLQLMECTQYVHAAVHRLHRSAAPESTPKPRRCCEPCGHVTVICASRQYIVSYVQTCTVHSIVRTGTGKLTALGMPIVLVKHEQQALPATATWKLTGPGYVSGHVDFVRLCGGT